MKILLDGWNFLLRCEIISFGRGYAFPNRLFQNRKAKFLPGLNFTGYKLVALGIRNSLFLCLSQYY